jgi:hypothetical protein
VQTPADLNALADAQAALYDEVELYTADPGLTGANVATGGEAAAITFGAGGADGPTSDHAAVDGIAWSSVVSFTLTDTATHFGLLDGGVFRRGHPLPSPLGPGSVPFVCGLGPAAL